MNSIQKEICLLSPETKNKTTTWGYGDFSLCVRTEKPEGHILHLSFLDRNENIIILEGNQNPAIYLRVLCIQIGMGGARVK